MNLTPINIYTHPVTNENLINDFSLYLCDILSSLRILHWYSKNYNFHEIIGNFYSDFDKMFDNLMEEIIGVCSIQNINFTVKSPERDLKKINQCECVESQINEIFSILESMENTLKNEDMQYFISLSRNGINNTIDEIQSLSNKLKYLLKMFDKQTFPLNNSYST